MKFLVLAMYLEPSGLKWSPFPFFLAAFRLGGPDRPLLSLHQLHQVLPLLLRHGLAVYLLEAIPS